ncbi:MAG TPA: serine/threonine-protein kinase, partial [Povalibacter sp.]
APYAATLQASSDKTEAIAGRLVQSLDDIPVSRRGALQPGSIIKKRFVLDSLLGKGGMGLVFGAIDRRKEEAQDPNPRVALKVLNADFERHPQSFIALQREARKAQTLAHPNVVTVFDFDRDGETVYMTMELLTGRPLEAIVREARGNGVKPEVAMPIIRGIAEGLAYAHRKGIVHSDLKPGNVFIGEDGTPKILDFGIARAVPSSVTPENKDVFDAGSLGAYTEAYATDEMIDGVDPHPADDMYALGIIGYELLTGFHPYKRHGAPAARKMGLKPPPLKGLKMREAKALERCLSFDRNQRPKDAADFLKSFRGVTALQKASIAVAAVLAVATGYFWYQNYLETSPAIAFAELPLEVQQRITAELSDGDQEWAFYQQGITPAVEEAVVHYATAYDLHPRNHDAVKGLRKAGDEILRLSASDPEMHRAAAASLLERSEFYRKYTPVVEAAK